jgi:hypothetical protein
MHYTAAMNDGKYMFVFGSNEAGIHGAGAALQAETHWGAVHRLGFGPSGQSFAIPTKDWQINTLPLSVIHHYVERFLAYATANAECNTGVEFLVTPIGTGLAGYTHAEIAPMFAGAPTNCRLPEEWQPYLGQARPSLARKPKPTESKL